MRGKRIKSIYIAVAAYSKQSFEKLLRNFLNANVKHVWNNNINHSKLRIEDFFDLKILSYHKVLMN